MNEYELDKSYLDDNFISKINNLDNENLSGLFNLILDDLTNEINNEKISSINNIISALFGNEINSTLFFRQAKYLINKGLYNRLSKKYRNDLLSLNFNQEKTDLLIELMKTYIDKIAEINKKSEMKEDIVKDFEIQTTMPVYTTNYHIKEEKLNEDYKKQTLTLKLELENKNSNNNKELFIEMNKSQLVNFYEEIEKIQEKLDKLY